MHHLRGKSLLQCKNGASLWDRNDGSRKFACVSVLRMLEKCFSCTLPSNLYFQMTLKQQSSCIARDGVLHSRWGAEGVSSLCPMSSEVNGCIVGWLQHILLFSGVLSPCHIAHFRWSSELFVALVKKLKWWSSACPQHSEQQMCQRKGVI